MKLKSSGCGSSDNNRTVEFEWMDPKEVMSPAVHCFLFPIDFIANIVHFIFLTFRKNVSQTTPKENTTNSTDLLEGSNSAKIASIKNVIVQALNASATVVDSNKKRWSCQLLIPVGNWIPLLGFPVTDSTNDSSTFSFTGYEFLTKFKTMKSGRCLKLISVHILLDKMFREWNLHC